MSTLKLYRLTARKYARDLSGEGARLYGGRWNHVGTPCLYTAENRALAVLEYSVNVDLDDVPRALSLITIEVPDSSIRTYTAAELPGNWREAPAPAATQDFGTALLQSREALLIRIPSTVVPFEYNYLVNPLHPMMGSVQIVAEEDFVYDVRIKD